MKLIVNRNTSSNDVLCIILARYGFSYKVIQQRTGLSIQQIKLRLKQTNTKVREFRNGETHLAQQVLDTVNSGTEFYLKQIKKQLQLKE